MVLLGTSLWIGSIPETDSFWASRIRSCNRIIYVYCPLRLFFNGCCAVNFFIHDRREANIGQLWGYKQTAKATGGIELTPSVRRFIENWDCRLRKLSQGGSNSSLSLLETPTSWPSWKKGEQPFYLSQHIGEILHDRLEHILSWRRFFNYVFELIFCNFSTGIE